MVFATSQRVRQLLLPTIVLFVVLSLVSLLPLLESQKECGGEGERNDDKVGSRESEQMKVARQRLAKYAAWHSEMMSLGHTEESKYLIWKAPPLLGLGNRMQSLMSAFMLALVSDRLFFVDWSENRGVQNPDEGPVYSGTLQVLFQNPDFAWDWSDHSARLNTTNGFPSLLRRQVDGIAAHLLCANYTRYFPQQFVLLTTWDYWAPLITQNPNYAKMIRQHFGTNYYHHISAFLFRPVETVQRTVRAFVDEHFEGKFVIALQIRQNVMTTWSKVNIHNGTRQSFLNCAQQLASMADVPKDKLLYFLATGDKESRATVQRHLSPLVFQNISLDDVNHAGPRDSVMALHQSLVDMYLLTHADALLISHGSTFGSLPASLADVRPWALDFHTLACTQHLTAEPCFAGWRPMWGQQPSCVLPEDAHRGIMNMGVLCFPLPVVGAPNQAARPNANLPSVVAGPPPPTGISKAAKPAWWRDGGAGGASAAVSAGGGVGGTSEAVLPPPKPGVCSSAEQWGAGEGDGCGAWAVCGTLLGDGCAVFSAGTLAQHWSFDIAGEGRGCRVYGFDPTAATTTLAAYNSARKQLLRISLGHSDHVYAAGKAPPHIWGHPNTQELRVVTVASVMAQLNIPRLTVLKLDVKGAERAILSQYVEAGTVLCDQILVKLCVLVEKHSGDKALLEALTSMGYVMWDKRQCGSAPHCWKLSFVYSQPRTP